MGKKDFSNSTENVFDDFFTQPTESKKIEKMVETTPVEEKKEVKTTPKKVETPKQTETKKPVKTTPKKEEIKEVEKPKEEITKVEEKPKELKSYNKDCRFNFYLDTELADFVNNHLWLTRQKNYSQYFNKLIRENLLEILGLPKNTSKEELSNKWEEYKKENDL